MPNEQANSPGSAGGNDARVFATTHWSVVLAAHDGNSPQAAEALEKLCRTYWYPLYAFVRRQGQDAEAAKDLTQEFFRHFLEKGLLESVQREKGKFRSFLLVAMKHFLSNQRREASRIKRGGGQTFLSLDEQRAEERYALEPETDFSPDRIFEQRWATTVMEQALQRLRQEQESSAPGKARQFERLKPFLSEEPGDGEYAGLATEFGLTRGAIGVAVHRLRQRYGELVRAEIAHTVSHPTEVDEELRHLRALLSG
jgi:RNA polymerase sigma-70 factor (ECF subfamily)